jgi:hypothetical protein
MPADRNREDLRGCGGPRQNDRRRGVRRAEGARDSLSVRSPFAGHADHSANKRINVAD